MLLINETCMISNVTREVVGTVELSLRQSRQINNMYVIENLACFLTLEAFLLNQNALKTAKMCLLVWASRPLLHNLLGQESSIDICLLKAGLL